MKPNSLASLQAALGHHQAGRLAEAEQLYRAVLRADANDPDALNLLGVLEYQRGQNLEALEGLSKAIQVSPQTAIFHNNLGLVLVALGRQEEASQRFEEAGRLDARLRDAFHNLGVARQELGQVDLAIDAYLKALSLAEEPGTLNNLGAAYLKSGRREEAMRCFEHALQLQPDHAGTLFSLAGALLESGRATEAKTWCRQARLGQPSAQVCANLADILEQRLEFTGAEDLLRQALKLQPYDSAAFNRLGNVLLATGRPEEAVLAYDQAIHLGEDDPVVYYNRGHARLVLGDLAGGWDDYEYRWLWKGFPHQRPPVRPTGVDRG